MKNEEHTFHPHEYSIFEYSGFTLKDSVLTMDYRLVGEKGALKFREEIELPAPPQAPTEQANEAAQRLARLIFLASGPSYYKAAAPATVRIIPKVTVEEVQYLRDLYFYGMTEFAYINKLRKALEPTFEPAHIVKAEPIRLEPREGREPLVPIGGGKDSNVTIEALRSAGFRPLLFSQNTFPPQQRSAEVAKLDYIVAKRRLDPQILTLHSKGAYNGHIPITAQVSLVSLLVAVLWGRGTVVMSNERSADVGNVMWEGVEVNHQWSKSLVAEEMLHKLLHAVVATDLEYFSLLRPFSELRITRHFATLKQYHGVFTSCNRAFRLVEERRSDNWCGHCDKCRFVFLALAPYISRSALEKIFNGNLLADGTQLAGFRELLGIVGHKPLECVGEIEECRAALMLIAEKSEWHDVPEVQVLMDDLPKDALPTKAQMNDLFSTNPNHCIPKDYEKAIYAIS